MRDKVLRNCVTKLMLLGIGAMIPAPVLATELHRFPIDSLAEVIIQDGVQFDQQVSSDGNGSLRVIATKPTVVPLFEVSDIELENSRLIYQARVRTEGVEGQVYLEMWCHFAGHGEFFSRGLEDALSGTRDWKTLETPFFLRKGENPDLVKLNLVVQGSGTTWIDDVRLLKGPLALTSSMGGGKEGSEVHPWFDAARYAWIPGTCLGLLGGLIGTLAGMLAWRGKAKRWILGLEGVTLIASIALLVMGVVALLSGQPYGVWYGLSLPGMIGTLLLGWILPMTARVYRTAEQRRLSAEDL